MIRRYIEWLEKDCGYLENEIIILENHKVSNYVDNNKLYSFSLSDEVENATIRTKRAYKIFKELSPNSYYIKMPYGTFSNSEHKWGLSRLHYDKLCYEYYYEAVTAITKGCNQFYLDNLHEIYSNKMLIKRDEYIRNSLENYLENVSFMLESPYQISGHEKCILDNWKTINWSTKVNISNGVLRIEHSNSNSMAQMNVIQIVKNSHLLSGKEVTFSVFARVIQLTNEGYGGEIALINAENYNDGKLYKRVDFTNQDWKQIILTTKLPKGDEFKGCTICLRARAGGKENPIHASVEFMNPRLTIGTF